MIVVMILSLLALLGFVLTCYSLKEKRSYRGKQVIKSGEKFTGWN